MTSMMEGRDAQVQDQHNGEGGGVQVQDQYDGESRGVQVQDQYEGEGGGVGQHLHNRGWGCTYMHQASVLGVYRYLISIM
jgi:hypothetical protein